MLPRKSIQRFCREYRSHHNSIRPDETLNRKHPLKNVVYSLRGRKQMEDNNRKYPQKARNFV